MQALILRVLVARSFGGESAKSSNLRLILRSSAKHRTEPTLSARCVFTDRMSYYWTSPCQ